MSAPVEHLTVEDVLILVRHLGAGPVRDVGLLEAAVARSCASVFGADAYPSLELKAAALLHSLVRNHALVDGDKRLGWLAAVVLLDLNGHETALDDDDAFMLVMDAARGTAELAEIARRLLVRPRGAPANPARVT